MTNPPLLSWRACISSATAKAVDGESVIEAAACTHRAGCDARKGGEAHGAGLGLAIAHEIVAAHGGRISVRSHVGAGTTMEVILPLAPPNATKSVRYK